MAKKGLGKGLGAIFGEDIIKESENEAVKAAVRRKKAAAAEEGSAETVEENPTGRLMVKVALIEPNKEQPRVDFNEEQMAELAESIKKRGVLQPLLVQKKGAFYEIIAGERRWRAAKMAGLKEVPVVVGEYSRQESMEIALIENVQRADLNPNMISSGHARALLGLDDKELQLKAAKMIVDGGLSVRETERLVKRMVRGLGKRKNPRRKRTAST